MADKFVVGIYQTQAGAAFAVRRLLEIGYDSDDISVLAKNPERFAMLELQTDVEVTSPNESAAGAGAGAAAGGVLGGIMALGTLMIPGVGPFFGRGAHCGSVGRCHRGGCYRRCPGRFCRDGGPKRGGCPL